MKKNRILATVLALLTVASLFAACNDTTEDESSVAVQSEVSSAASIVEEESSEEEVSVGPLDHLEDQDLDLDIYFLVNSVANPTDTCGSIEICPYEGELKFTYMNEIVLERNRMIEEKLGVRINEIRTTNMSGDIIKAVNSGSQEFQIACPYMTEAGPLVTSGSFYDLYEFRDVINFDAPYWDNNANESLSINNKLYFTTGDFSLLSLDVTHCMVFNRDMIAENGLENPYDLVAEGKWTFDKLMELSRAVTADTDGEPGYTWKDNIGLQINTNYSNSLFIGSGERFVRKDSNDMPYLAIYTEHAADVVAKITDIFHSEGAITIESYSALAQKAGFAHCWAASRDALANKRSLFLAISLSDIISISNTYDCNFGLLVTPKYDETQDTYHSYISVIAATCCVIPTSNPDPKTAALVLEALNASSTDTTKKHYYQRVLKAQKLRDEEGEQMLDFIFDNRIYDLGAIYDWGGLRDFLNSICVNGKDKFASKYEHLSGVIETSMAGTLKFVS